MLCGPPGLPSSCHCRTQTLNTQTGPGRGLAYSLPLSPSLRGSWGSPRPLHSTCGYEMISALDEEVEDSGPATHTKSPFSPRQATSYLLSLLLTAA